MRANEQGPTIGARAWLPVMCICFPLVVGALAARGATVTLESKQADIGSTFALSVFVEDVSDLYGAAFDVTYDSTELEVVDADPGTGGVQPDVTDAGLLNDRRSGALLEAALQDGEAGRLVIGICREGNVAGIDVSGQQTLVQIEFEPLQMGTFDLEFSRNGLRDSAGDEIGATWVNSQVVVSFVDTDTDGLSDAWEMEHFKSLSQGADDDYDGDWETNLTEQTNDTNPADASSAHDAENVYGGCHFELYMAANQTSARADFSQPWWGYWIMCTARDEETITAGTVTVPSTRGGRDTITLTPASDGSLASAADDSYADFASLAADFPDGTYEVHLTVTTDGRDTLDLRVEVELDAYTEPDFPGLLAVTDPAPDAVAVARAPLLQFDVADWHFVRVREQDGAGAYYQVNDAQEDSQHQMRIGLDAGTTYDLVAAAASQQNALLHARTLLSFTTSAEFRIPIRLGWNCISIPFATEQTVADLFTTASRKPEKIGEVWGWDRRQYYMLDDTDILQPKRGYWVLCTREDDLVVVQSAASGAFIDIVPGWNLLGPISACSPPNSAALRSDFYRWDPVSSKYLRVTANEKMAPGTGYWFRAAYRDTVQLGQ